MMQTSFGLTVSARLALGFGLVALVLTVVCGIGYRNSAVALDRLHNELGKAQDASATANVLLNAVQQQDIAVRNIGLLSEPAAMQSYADETRAANKSFTSALDRAKKLGLPKEDLALLEEISSVNAKNGPVVEKAISTALAFLSEDAVKVINEQLNPLSQQRRKLVVQFAQSQQRVAQQAMDAMEADARSSRTLMLVAGLVGVGCAVLCAWLVSRSISRPLASALSMANRVAQGDLTVSLQAEGNDEIGRLVQALAGMTGSLRQLIGKMSNTSESLMTATSEIAAGNQDLSSRTEDQAKSLQSTVAIVEQLSGTVQKNADSARKASELATQATSVADLGGTRVAEVVTMMNSVSQSSQRIADIVSMIDGIAFQTNILALNAAVEAARAGEHGRGFAVVAGEVRTLAQRSATAAKEIKDLVATNVETVTAGSRLVDDAGATMADIVRSSQQVAAIVSEITSASAAQARDLVQVNAAISQIDRSTQQNAALVEQAAAAAESLKEQTRGLTESVSVFKTADSVA